MLCLAAGFYAGLLVIGVGLFCCYARIGKLLRCILFTSVTGLAALFILSLAGGAGGAALLSMTPLSAAVSALLGMPGVLAMLVINLL